MSLSYRLVRFASQAVAVAVLAWAAPAAKAADVTRPAPVVAAAPVGVGDPGCAACEHGAVAGGCAACKHRVLLQKNKTPYQVNLCPGACFGYFQTQWRKWDDACPYPYLGHGVSDAPRPAQPVVNVPRPDPKAGGVSPVPDINKFAP